MKKSLTSLAFGTLGLGISEYVMMGILSDIAESLSVSVPQAGHMISAYAIGVCVGAPLTVMVARKSPLKKILYGLVAMILVGNLFTALAPGYGMMLIFRFVSGLPHGAFFGVGSIVAEKVADKGKTARAISLMIAGMTVANVIGVPLGTFVTHLVSWRLVFLIVAAWGVVTLYFVHRWVPALPALPDNNGLKGQFSFLKNLAPWLIIFATILGNGGIFCWYSYVNPFIMEHSGFDAVYMTPIMVLAGLGMYFGNIGAGRLSDRFAPDRVACVTQLVSCAALATLFLTGQYGWMAIPLMFLLTGCLFAASMPEQLLILQNSRGCELLGAACIQVAFNLGNALGAYCGGLPIDRGYGYEYTALTGIPFAFAGFLLLFVYVKKYGRKRSPRPHTS